MVLTLGWAWSMQFAWTYLDLDQMARWHGTLNAIGFGFAALTGLHLARPTGTSDRQVALRHDLASDGTPATPHPSASNGHCVRDPARHRWPDVV
jgi:hypothetical protein